MAQYSDVNSGIIGVNGFKKAENHPDMAGRINVEGVWYWLKGWNKQSNGNQFTSLALTIMTQPEVDEMLRKRAEKDAAKAQQRPPQQQGQPQTRPQQQQQAPAQQTPPAGHPASEPMDFDDDIPF